MRSRLCLLVLSALVLVQVTGPMPAASAAGTEARSTPVDGASAADDGTAAAIAEHYGHDVTIDDATTETNLAVAHPDGSFTMTVSAQPVRVRRGDQWVVTDRSLVRDAGMLIPVAAAVPVRFSAGGSGPLVQVQAPSGQWLSESWQAGALPAPVVAGDTATYPDVLPGVDLSLTATATGMAEVLVVRDAEAAANPALRELSFGLSDGALATSPAAGGAAVAAAPDGAAQLVAAAATWWDSSSQGASVAGPGDLGVPAPVQGTISDAQVIVDASNVLQASDLTFPVYLDPTWTGGNAGWGFVDSAYPDTAYWKDAGASDSYQHVGFVDTGASDDGRDHTTRSYWQMNTAGVAGAAIKSAHFDTTEVYSFSCAGRQVDLWTVSAPTPSTTWDTRTIASSLVATANVGYGYSSACPGHAVGFDATAAVQRAAGRSSPVINLELRAHDEADVYGWKKFSSTAKLVIDYNNPPGQPTSLSFTQPQAPCVTGSARPLMNNGYPLTVQGHISDPDSGDTVYGTLQVLSLDLKTQYYAAKTGVISNSGGMVGFTIPANTLPNGTSFLWQLWATDNRGVKGPDSSHCEATIDDTSPSLPGVALASGQPTPTQVGSPVQVTLTSNPADHVSRFIYWWTATNQTAPSPPVPVQSVGPGYVLPACGSFSNGAAIACADASGSATVTVAPIDLTATLWVAGVDAAGNVSTATDQNGQSSSATGKEFDGLQGDVADFEQGHAWRTDTASGSPMPTSLPDEATAAPAQLSLNPAVGWSTGQALRPTSSSSVLTFNGSSSVATAPYLLDIAKPFTVAAWVYPQGTQARYYSALSTDSTGTSATGASGVQLQYYAGSGATGSQAPNAVWRMCMPNGTSSNDCATSAAGSVQLNSWTFVAGEWDPVNHNVRLYLNGAVAATASHLPTATVASGQFVVGRAWWNSAVTDWWSGAVESPIVVQSLSDSVELGNAMQAGPSNAPFFQCVSSFGDRYSCQ